MRLINADVYECVSYKGVPDGYDDSFDGGVLWMLDHIDEQPTIEPKRGKWSVGGYFDEIYGRSCICSVCGRDAFGFTRYCPSCGAKMEVGEDG